MVNVRMVKHERNSKTSMGNLETPHESLREWFDLRLERQSRGLKESHLSQ